MSHPPHGVDGLARARNDRQRDALRDLAVVLMSPLGTVVEPDRIRKAGIRGWTTKPLRKSQLLDRLMDATAGGHTRRAAKVAPTPRASASPDAKPPALNPARILLVATTR